MSPAEPLQPASRAERMRRYFAGIELVVFVSPVALLCVEYIVFYGVYPLIRSDRALLPPMDLAAYLIPLGQVLVGIVCLVAGVRIMLGFMVSGQKSLRELSRGWWALACLGALLSIVSLLLWSRAARLSGIEVQLLRGWLTGLPAVVPMVHMLIERASARDHPSISVGAVER